MENGPESSLPPPAIPPGPEEKGAVGWRIGAGFLALLLALAAAIVIVTMADLGGTPTCEDVLSGAAAVPADRECFDGSAAQKTISVILGWPGGILAALAALAALAFAFTGKRGRLVVQLSVAAVVLVAISILVAQI
jgi:hypothetical protein